MGVKGKESGLFDVECCNGQIYKQKRRQTENGKTGEAYTWTLHGRCHTSLRLAPGQRRFVTGPAQQVANDTLALQMSWMASARCLFLFPPEPPRCEAHQATSTGKQKLANRICSAD